MEAGHPGVDGRSRHRKDELLNPETRPIPERDSPSPAGMRPSAVRWQILGLMLLLSMITYLDRVNISIAARHITDAYHLTDVQMGKIFSAFILAYGVFQVPGGWLGDLLGPRKVLTFAVIWWSAFTALTAYAADLLRPAGVPIVVSLCLVRFCLGMGEAAAWPSFNRTIANWMAMKERAFATSVPLAGGGAGAAITPPFIAWLMLTYGWRESFLISGVLGVAASALWYLLTRDTPEQHRRVNRAELAIIHARAAEPQDAMVAAHLSPVGARRTPWRRLLTDKNVLLLFSSAMTCGYMVYIYMTWFFTYLVEQRGLSEMKSSYYTIGPFIAMAVLTPLGGIASDIVSREKSLRSGRRLIAMGGMFAAGMALIVGARVERIGFAIVWLSFGAGAIYFALASHWATTIDVSEKYAGTVSGLMNLGGNVGGILSPILTPILARKLGWVPALEIAAIIIIAGGMLWLVINPERKLASS